jgi:hypothetical protein
MNLSAESCGGIKSYRFPVALKVIRVIRAICEICGLKMEMTSKMASLKTWTPVEYGSEEMCPVLDNPEPDCYCLNLTSLDIPKAVQFCLRNFRQCPIYTKYMGSAES